MRPLPQSANGVEVIVGLGVPRTGVEVGVGVRRNGVPPLGVTVGFGVPRTGVDVGPRRSQEQPAPQSRPTRQKRECWPETVSHCSSPFVMPSPQNVQSSRQRWARPTSERGGSHVSPGSMRPSPQDGVSTQRQVAVSAPARGRCSDGCRRGRRAARRPRRRSRRTAKRAVGTASSLAIGKGRARGVARLVRRGVDDTRPRRTVA